MTKSSMDRLRVGDLVRVIVPHFVVRVGYPKSIEDYLPEVDAHMPAVDEVLARLMKSHGGLFGHGLRGSEPCELRIRGRIRRDLAYLCAKADGFGGRERTVHFREMPEYASREACVAAIRTAVTGTYCPASGGTNYFGEDEYDPPGLMNEKRVRLAELGFWCDGPLTILTSDLEKISTNRDLPRRD